MTAYPTYSSFIDDSPKPPGIIIVNRAVKVAVQRSTLAHSTEFEVTQSRSSEHIAAAATLASLASASTAPILRRSLRIAKSTSSSSPETPRKKSRLPIVRKLIRNGTLIKRNDSYYVEAKSGTIYKLTQTANEKLSEPLDDKTITFSEEHQALGIYPRQGAESRTTRRYYCACGAILYGIGNQHTKNCGKKFPIVSSLSLDSQS